MKSKTGYRKMLSCFNRIASAGIVMLGIVFLLLCLITACIYVFPTDTADIHSYDSPLVLLILGLFAVLSLVLGKLLFFIRKKIHAFDWILLFILIAIWCFVSIVFIMGAKELPSSDAKSCYDLAVRFLHSDFSAVIPRDSYLSLWPYQTGLIFVMEKMMRIFRTTEPCFFQIVNILYCALGFVGSYGLLKEFTDREEILVAFMLLTFSDFVLTVECVEIYGNIPCFELMFFSAWMFVKMMRSEEKILPYVFGFLGMGSLILANVYKGNALIFAIALLLVGTWEVANDPKKKWKLIIIALSFIISLSATKLTAKYYEHYAHNVMGKGVPAIAFVAMGLQNNGGWNGFHSNTYMDTGYDYDETVRISRESLRDSVSGFANDPLEAIRFFYWKLLKQWSYETRAAFWGVNAIWEEPRTEFAISVENGTYKNIIEWIANYRQSILYFVEFLGLLFWIFAREIRRKSPFLHFPLVFFIGGFLFSLIWEAHAGYAYAYVTMMLPFLLPLSMEPILKKIHSMKEK